MMWPIPADTHSTRIGKVPHGGSPKTRPEQLDDDALLAILREEEAAASHYQWSALSRTREDALACYDREPYGDEHPKSLVAQKKRVTSHAGRVFLPDNYGGLGMQIRISY